jgi:hypothetical protein
MHMPLRCAPRPRPRLKPRPRPCLRHRERDWRRDWGRGRERLTAATSAAARAPAGRRGGSGVSMVRGLLRRRRLRRWRRGLTSGCWRGRRTYYYGHTYYGHTCLAILTMALLLGRWTSCHRQPPRSPRSTCQAPLDVPWAVARAARAALAARRAARRAIGRAGAAHRYCASSAPSCWSRCYLPPRRPYLL